MNWPIFICPPTFRFLQRPYSFTFTGFTFQISSQYWAIALSEEKKPMRAVFRIDICVQRSLSAQAFPASCCFSA